MAAPREAGSPDTPGSPGSPGSNGARVALVTGSARGLGLAVARALRARGERVHVTWRSESPEAAGLRAEFGPRAHRADLCDARDAAALAATVHELDGRLDHAVHAV